MGVSDGPNFQGGLGRPRKSRKSFKPTPHTYCSQETRQYSFPIKHICSLVTKVQMGNLMDVGFELEDIWPSIMARGIEIKLSADTLIQIQGGCQHSLFSKQRPSEYLS